MPKRKLILLAVALLIAGLTGIMAKSMMAGGGKDAGPAQQAAATTQVLVAARDMPSGTMIKETDVKWQVWPVDGTTDGFAVKGKNETSEYVGAVVRQGLRTGEPIMNGRVMRAKEQGFMAAVLSPGMRAVSVAITPIAGVAGFVFPGDHVDVIVAHQVSRQAGESQQTARKVSETVLVDVRVLALDQKTDDQAMEPKVAQTATLEVTPKQAEKLALVAELGTLSLSLRSIANDQQTPASVAAADVADQAVTAADPARSESMTWDSDVSRVLAKPNNRNGIIQHVQILRGKESTESVFDIRQ